MSDILNYTQEKYQSEKNDRFIVHKLYYNYHINFKFYLEKCCALLFDSIKVHDNCALFFHT